MKRANVDSCVLIYAIESPEGFGSVAREMLALHGDAIELCISDLVRLECLVHPLWQSDRALEAQYRAAFEPYRPLDLHRAVFERAANLRANQGVRTPDALHLAAAMEHGCDEFWTNDTRLTGAAPNLKVRAIGPDQPTP